VKVMSKAAATILLVSGDADLRSQARQELETRRDGIRVASVSNLAAAWRVLEEAAPAVIVLEDLSINRESSATNGEAHLTEAVSSLATYAPVVFIGAPEHRRELSALVSAGAADYVERNEGCVRLALHHIERRLERTADCLPCPEPQRLIAYEDFGEVLRHELNNPLTGILGNAELLLAEIRRKNDGRLPGGAQQRVETIAALAVRLRETVRRLSLEWEARQADTH
jgi:signal transduction histidine kinase